MHPTSLENMLRCWDRYVRGTELETQPKLTILDMGGADVNGSYRSVLNGPNVEYLAADLEPGPGVDVVLEDPYRIPLEDGAIDLVVSGQMLEHCEFFWLTFSEMMRVVNPDGYLFLIAPSAGGIHRYPVDCYRFHPDAYHALAKYAGCHLVDVWHDQRGTWRDLVGVFSWRSDREPRIAKHAEDIPAGPLKANRKPEHELVRGDVHYTELLARMHKVLKPKLYLEIGVNWGVSLALARGRAVGVDPRPDLKQPLAEQATLVEMQSDDFFEKSAELIEDKADFVFIDGMHLFEFALRDFMNVEKHASPNAVVVIDDIYPNHPEQAARDRHTGVWTGDIWKLHELLRTERPDLFLMPIDSKPTGLLLVWGLDRSNRKLWEKYDSYIRKYVHSDPSVPEPVIQRQGALPPERLDAVLSALLSERKAGAGRGKTVLALRAAAEGTEKPRDPKPARTPAEPSKKKKA